MVHHIIMWDLNENVGSVERQSVLIKIKEELERLPGIIGGLTSLKIVYEFLPGCNTDVALISTFENKEALESYQSHPEHVKSATYVRSVTKNRRVIDFEE